MEITPVDSSLFRAAIEAMKEFLPEAHLRITADGVVIRGMDRSHVGFVDYFLSKEDCTTLKVPKPLTIDVNLSLLGRVLANISSGDVVTLGLNKTKDRLIVTHVNERISKRAVYELALLSLIDEIIEPNEMDYDARVVVKSSDLIGAIREVGAFDERIVLELNEEGFHFSAEGTSGKASQTLLNTEDREMELGADQVVAPFATRYLTQILKGGAALASTTVIQFDPAQPLRAIFKHGSQSHLIMYLAPMITD